MANPEKEKPALMVRLYESDKNCDGDCKNCVAICGTTQNTIFLEAADAIEELLAAVPKWISVEERLPEKHQVVLFYIPWNKSCMIGWRDESGQIRLEGYGGVYERSLINPSHWMLLPKAPKEE